MAKNYKPLFIGEPKILGQASMTAANTALDGTGTTYTIVSGAADGTHVKHIVLAAAGNTTAGRLALFAVNGATKTLIFTVLVDARTPSATINPYQLTVPINRILGTGDSIEGCTYNAETFKATAWGGDLTA